MPTRLYCDELHDDHDGLKILLRNDECDKAILMTFPHAFYYQVSSDIFKSLDYFQPGKHVLYYANTSTLIEWFVEETRGVYDSDVILHYVVLAADSWISVLCNEAPILQYSDC
jgi:hypothetical protein